MSVRLTLITFLCLLGAAAAAQCSNPIDLDAFQTQLETDGDLTVGEVRTYCVISTVDAPFVGTVGVTGDVAFAAGTVTPTISLVFNDGATVQTLTVADPIEFTPGTTYEITVTGLLAGTTTLNLEATALGITQTENIPVTVAAPLPVSLVSFTGTAADKHNVLEWTTAGEEAFSHYVVERSTAREPWTDLGAVAGAGLGRVAQGYAYRDATPPPAALYRLRMVDADGSYAYSPTVSLAQPVDAWSVYPNPAGEVFTVARPAGAAVTELILRDTNGRTVRRIAPGPEAATVRVFTAGLTPGLYLLETDAGAVRVVVH